MENNAEINQLLGTLKGDMESSQRQRESLFNMMREATTAIHSVQTIVTVIQSDLKNHMDKENMLQDDHEDLKGRVETLESDKNMIVGGTVALALGTGGAWAKIMGFFS